MRTNDNGTDRDMTAEETAYIKQAQKDAQADAEKRLEIDAAQQAAAASARAKLAALGLTEAEIAALLGA